MGASTAIVPIPALWHPVPAFVSNIADMSSANLTTIRRVIPSDTDDQSCTWLNRSLPTSLHGRQIIRNFAWAWLLAQ